MSSVSSRRSKWRVLSLIIAGRDHQQTWALCRARPWVAAGTPGSERSEFVAFQTALTALSSRQHNYPLISVMVEIFILMLDSFLIKSPLCRQAGKKLLLITNSDYHYTNKMMQFAFDQFLPDGMSWRELFDMVCWNFSLDLSKESQYTTYVGRSLSWLLAMFLPSIICSNYRVSYKIYVIRLLCLPRSRTSSLFRTHFMRLLQQMVSCDPHSRPNLVGLSLHFSHCNKMQTKTKRKVVWK